MTLLKKTTFLPFLLLLQFSCSYETPEYDQKIQSIYKNEFEEHNYSNYIGDWYHDNYDTNNEAKSTLSIQIDDVSDSSIKGEYCYVSNYGKKIDCENNFEGKAINKNQYEIFFYSSFYNLKGQATLTLDKQNVIWKLNSFPKNLGIAAPNKAVLERENLHTTKVVINQPDNVAQVPERKSNEDSVLQEISQNKPLYLKDLVDYTKEDLSSLIVSDDKEVIGIIGEQYKRLIMKLDSAHKTQDRTYRVTGSSLVKENITKYQGFLNLSKVYSFKKLDYGIDDEYINKDITEQNIAVFSYELKENPKKKYSGIFKGKTYIKFYKTSDGKIHYDDINIHSDGYFNRLYNGTWTQYDSYVSKKASWADYNLPRSIAPNLDIGVGEFSPNPDYYPSGWQSYEQ